MWTTFLFQIGFCVMESQNDFLFFTRTLDTKFSYCFFPESWRLNMHSVTFIIWNTSCVDINKFWAFLQKWVSNRFPNTDQFFYITFEIHLTGNASIMMQISQISMGVFEEAFKVFKHRWHFRCSKYPLSLSSSGKCSSIDDTSGAPSIHCPYQVVVLRHLLV